MKLTDIGCEKVNSIELAKDKLLWQAFVKKIIAQSLATC